MVFFLGDWNSSVRGVNWALRFWGTWPDAVSVNAFIDDHSNVIEPEVLVHFSIQQAFLWTVDCQLNRVEDLIYNIQRHSNDWVVDLH